jgi:hypothetical protein
VRLARFGFGVQSERDKAAAFRYQQVQFLVSLVAYVLTYLAI